MSDTSERLRVRLADRYRIERELGAGGMATVYLAHDLRHERDVAIKVLHPDLGAALGGERFLTEIRTTARLQHPHILPLLDSGEADGLLYYVMPLVTGETLRARLERERQLPITDAVRIAREVASALDYAHRQNVIHRDIKPENILLHDGQAIVADFGIALAVQSAGGQRMTQTGLSLGTPQYMSPEQAMGERTIDARSDVYALGAVLYEMLAGDAPFTGGSVQAIVAKVLSERPTALHTLRDTVPAHVEQAVFTALAKLPADRWATAREFADVLQGGAVSGADSNAVASRYGNTARRISQRTRWRDPVVLTLGALAVVSAAFAAWTYRTTGTRTEAAVVRFAIPAPQRGGNVALGLTALAISRDGTTLVYVGQGANRRSQLFVRALDDIVVHPLTGTEDGDSPIFSPDGKSIAFMRASQLYRVALAGGTPQRLGALPGTSVGSSWSSIGSIVVSANGAMYLIPEAAGTAQRLTKSESTKNEQYQLAPLVFDEGNVVIYASWGDNNIANATLAMASLTTGEQTMLDVRGTHALGVVDGNLVYVSSTGVVMAAPFDIRKRRVTGTPVQVVTGLRVNNTTGLAQAALSENGTLFYQNGIQLTTVVLKSSDGSTSLLLEEPGDFGFPRLSPNGKQLAITQGTSERRDIWLYDMSSKSSTRLTNEGTTNERPEWSPDGSRVLFRTDQSGKHSDFWWRPVDLSATATPLLSGDRLDVFEAVLSPDGQFIAYQVDTSGADVYYRALRGDTTAYPVANSKFLETMPRFSPDGKWLAFVTDESGMGQVVVQPFPGPGARTQVSTQGGSEPIWSRDNKQLYYRGSGKLMAASVRATPSFTVVKRDTVFADEFVFSVNPHANYDVMPDDRHFVFLKSERDGDLIVVSNFRRVLRDRIAASVAK